MRKSILLVAGVLLSVGTLAACVGPPPPPPTDPHDVLVVGDSVAFSFGCVLGDPGEIPGIPPGSCPSTPDYSTRNDWTGACTITPGTLSLYNGGTAGAPNCDTVAAGSRGQTWAEAANFFVPKVVVINTAGWEIQDRWQNFVATPDLQWGGSTGGQPYQNAAAYYSNELYNAINMFRASPRNPTVIVTNAPYIAPPQPLPPPGDVPAGVECSWWEPYPPSPPVSEGPDCTGNATPGSGGSWRPQAAGITYRSSRTKLDQFNGIVDLVKNDYFGGDPKVQVFNFKKHFNGPANAYTDYVCPPPNDFTVAPDPITHSCVITNPSPGVVPAILARADDNGHLSPAGTTDILKPYIDACVRHHLGLPGGDPGACS